MTFDFVASVGLVMIRGDINDSIETSIHGKGCNIECNWMWGAASTPLYSVSVHCVHIE
jgi:hypothetical protein